MAAWTKGGQRAFDADEMNAVMIESLTDAEALEMLLNPELFLQKRDAIEAKSAARVASALSGYTL